MERIVYRITLDSHKTGIQRTLQGFETADNMARTIAVNITASGDTYEIPLDNVVAMMYVTTPNASEPSINECRIEDNTIYYDVLPIVEEGITEMKIKLIETSVDGAKRVLIAPKFVVEVTESGTEDDSAEQTTTFTALENAIAKAHGVYDQRLLNIEIGPDCVFRAIYADGTVYENHYLHEALYNGNALLSESWAKGGTGIREGEETNNSKYFSDVSRSSSIEASASADEVRNLVDFAKLHSTYTSFDTNFETGELEYISASHTFDIDETTGELSVEGDLFDPSEVLESVADDYMDEKTQEIAQLKSDLNEYKGKTDVLESRPVNNNILINSNFANPVNQRGVTAETWVTEKYGIDRWRITNPYTKVTSIDSNGITFCTTDTTGKYNALIEQKIEASSLEIGKTYTLSAHINGEIYSVVITLKADVNNMNGTGVDGLLLEIDTRTLSAGRFELRIRNSKTTPLTVKWIKLEEGSVATPYVPRLYAEELELCKRYYYRTWTNDRANDYLVREACSGYFLLPEIIFPVEMRCTPTVTFFANSEAKSLSLSDWEKDTEITNVSTNRLTNKGMTCRTFDAENHLTTGRFYMFHYVADAEL